MRQAIVVAQSHARYGERELERAGAELRARGVQVVESHVETGHKALRRRIRQAVRSGASLIVAIGGDGTQTVAVSEIAHSKAVLGVVPAGTGNSFAASLGIDSPEVAFDTVARGRSELVDVGVVNGTRFANFATIGLASVIGEQTPRWLKHRIGPLAYGVAAIEPLLRHRPFRATIRWKKNRLKLQTHQIIIVSGRMYGHTPVTPESTLVDGQLTFFATSRTSPIDVARTYVSFLTNSQTAIPQAHYFRAKKLKIRTSRKATVSVDGAVVCDTPATFSVEPKALAVLVPGPLPGTDGR